MRLSRPCYDKPHRCPGWAGGGWKYGKTDRCENGGSIRVRKLDDSGHPGHPAEFRWRFSHCTKCDVVTWPYSVRFVDPSNYVVEIKSLWQRLQWWWEDRRP